MEAEAAQKTASEEESFLKKGVEKVLAEKKSVSQEVLADRTKEVESKAMMDAAVEKAEMAEARKEK